MSQKDLTIFLTNQNSSTKFSDSFKQLSIWSSKGLLKDYVVVDTTDANLLRDDEILRIESSFYSGLENPNTYELFELLANRNLSTVRVVNLQVPNDNLNNQEASDVDRVFKVIKSNTPPNLRDKLIYLNLIIPDTKWLDDRSRLQENLKRRANANILVVPEDRPSPEDYNQGVHLGKNFSSHAAFYMSICSALWKGVNQTPFDNSKSDQAGKTLKLVRGYGRIIVTNNIIDLINNNLRTQEGSYPPPSSEFNKVLDPDIHINNISLNLNKKFPEIITQNIYKGQNDSINSFFQFIVKALFRKKIASIDIEINKDKNEIKSILDRFSYNFENNNSDTIAKVSRAITSEASFKRVAKVPLFITEIKNTVLHEIDGNFFKEDSNNEIDVENNLVLNPDYLTDTNNENSLFSIIKSSILNVLENTIEKFNQVFENMNFDIENTKTEQLLDEFSERCRASFIFDVVLSILLVSSGIKYYDFLAETDIINFPSIGIYSSLSENFIYMYFFHGTALFFIFWIFKKSQLYRKYKELVNDYSEQIALFNEGKSLANEISRLTSLNNQVEDWGLLLNHFSQNPFGKSKQLLSSQDFLELDDERHLAFRIAEASINYNEVSNILRSIVKTGWITELFEELTGHIKDYFKETQEISYLKKEVFKEALSDVSNDSSGPRKTFRGYIESSFFEEKSKEILKEKIQLHLANTILKDIFSDPVEYRNAEGLKKDKIEVFLGEIKTKGESSESFLPGVWSSSAKVEKPKSVKDFVIWAQSETGDDYGDVKVYPIEEDIKIDGPLQRATFWLSVSPEVDPSQIFEPPQEYPDDGSNIELGDA